MTKRLIRFSKGPLAGQFRFVSTSSGCVKGPFTLFHSIDPNFPDDIDPWKKPPLMQAVKYPREPQISSSVDCFDKQTKADAAAAKRASAARLPARLPVRVRTQTGTQAGAVFNTPFPPIFKTLLEVFK